MKTKQLTLAAALVAVLAPSIASAQTQTKSIVLDARGQAVTTKDGECVTHNWPEDNVVCKGAGVVGIPNVVYFDFAKSSLNAKGKEVVNQVAEGIKGLGSYNVKLSGHADRVDTVAFNQRLSQRRADTVKKALVAKGVAASKITTEAYGETRNAVPTKDNVAEQLNRRVEIEVTK